MSIHFNYFKIRESLWSQ